MTNDSTECIVLFKNCNIHACSSKEICCSHTCRTTTDNCCFSFFCHCWCTLFLQPRFISIFSCKQFHIADMYRVFIEVTCTFTHAIMCTNRTCNKWKWVLLCNNFHCLFIFSFTYKLKICCNILMDWTSSFTWCLETIKQRHTIFHLS